MAWYVYLIIVLAVLGFLAVLAYWIYLKRHGRRILEEDCHLSGKDLVRLYKIQKKAEAKEKAKETDSLSH